MSTFRSFAVTYRPRGGITDEAVQALHKWLQDKYYFAVLEKQLDERHIHFQLWFDEPKRRVDIDKQVKRIAKRTNHTWDDAQAKVSVLVKVAYNDWYLYYLQENDLKTDDPNILGQNIPGDTVDYYPSEEEDAKMKARATAKDPFYHELMEKWEIFKEERELTGPFSLRDIALYLHHRQFIAKDMKVTTDSKRSRALCRTLHTYLTGEFHQEWWIAPPSKKQQELELLLETTQIPDLS
jgi:hypothetical protein